jgi:hypothetical protein
MHRDAPRCTEMPSPDQDAPISCVVRGGGQRAFSVCAVRRVLTPARAHSGACSLPPGAPRHSPLPPVPHRLGTWVAGRHPGSAYGASGSAVSRRRLAFALWVGSRLSPPAPPRSGPRRAGFFVRIVVIAPSWHRGSRGASSRPGGACGSDDRIGSFVIRMNRCNPRDAGVILSVRKETHAQVETLALLFSPMRFLLEETIGALCAFT